MFSRIFSDKRYMPCLYPRHDTLYDPFFSCLNCFLIQQMYIPNRKTAAITNNGFHT